MPSRRLALLLSLLCIAVAGCCLLTRDTESKLWSFDDDKTETQSPPPGDTKGN